MSSSSIGFHRIWIDQRAATEQRGLWLVNALDCLIGENLLTFLVASESDPQL